jgi:hypothetical protein
MLTRVDAHDHHRVGTLPAVTGLVAKLLGLIGSLDERAGIRTDQQEVQRPTRCRRGM